MQSDVPTIVVVDDAPEVRLLVQARLRVSGRLRVVGEGANGQDALALAKEHRPAVMLLDVSMPGMDGLEALPLVRAASPDTRVVLYSGFEEQGLAGKAAEVGAAAFLEKSMPVESLVDRLTALAAEARPTPAEAARTAAPAAAPAVAAPPAPAPAVAGSGSSGTARGDQAVLDEHLERFREVFEEAAIGMATMTLTGHLVRANRAFATLMQRTPKDLVGLFYGDLTHEEGDRLQTALAEILRQPVDVVQLEHLVRGPTDHRLVRATLAPVRDSGGRPLYLFLQVQDVTVERAAVEELRKSEERFRLLVDAVQDYAIFMLDPTGHVASWNVGAQRINGYRADEIIGQHFRVFYPPDVQARHHPENELRLAVRDGHYEEEGWRIRKDGSRFWANVVITALFNTSGEHVGFAKVTRDMSDRRILEQEREHALEALEEANAELAELNHLLRQAAEDQAEFLAVTAHELRTPIGVLAGSAETLSKYWSALTDEEREELFQTMTSSTGRLRRLLGDLLTASRLQTSGLEMRSEGVLVGDVVADAVAAVRSASPDAEVVVGTVPDVRVTADRDRLAQAVDNLLSNALRHGEPPVHVSVETEARWVQIRVSDQGSGVAASMRPRLFERFATGLPKGGTGLGLFIVRELARAHGGDAFYEPGTTEGRAGTFVIKLPKPDVGPVTSGP